MPDLSPVQILVLLAGGILIVFGLGAFVASLRPRRSQPIDARLRRLREQDLAQPASPAQPSDAADQPQLATVAASPDEAHREHETELVEDLFAEIFSLRVSVAQLMNEVNSLRADVQSRDAPELVAELTDEVNSLRDRIAHEQESAKLPVFLRRAA